MLLDGMWDDVIAGPQPDRGLGKLRKISTKPLTIDTGGEVSKFQRSISMPASPATPSTPATPTPRKDNVWRSVFHPGSNLATRSIGAQVFDKPSQPNSPTVYDCKPEEVKRILALYISRYFQALQRRNQEQASLRWQ